MSIQNPPRIPLPKSWNKHLPFAMAYNTMRINSHQFSLEMA